MLSEVRIEHHLHFLCNLLFLIEELVCGEPRGLLCDEVDAYKFEEGQVATLVVLELMVEHVEFVR